MFTKSTASPTAWLAFELNVLRRLKFASAILPLAGEPHLGAYLKRWNVRVAANDALQSAWIRHIAAIENNAERLSEPEIEAVLHDAYVPRYRLQNSALRRWFNETDAWWFDNVRQNIERIESPVKQAIAASLVMSVGDYALAFTEETAALRQPLSDVYKRLWYALPAPVDNRQNNRCQNKSAIDCIAENYLDLMFLRLPAATNQASPARFGQAAWREEWIRGTSDFWNYFETASAGKLGAATETKSQYLHLVEDALRAAAHIPTWAIAFAENGFVSTQDLVECVGRVRRVDTIFTKDFSELMGMKAVIITA